MEPKDIFLNQVGRLRSGWRFVVFAILFLLIVELDRQLIRFLLYLGPPGFVATVSGNWGYLVQAIGLLIVPGFLAGWLCCRVFEGLPPRSLGLSLQRGWIRDFLLGSFVGAVTLLFAAGLILLCGGFRFTTASIPVPELIGRTLVVSLVIFIIAAAGEEVVFRGYPLQTMARSHLAWVSIIITSIIFSWGHLNNPNAVPSFTFINTAVAGVWLGVAYLKTRNLWFPLGIHWAWNWTMGAVLGIPVSGINSLTPHPLLQTVDLGPQWMTGGSYGIEGGAACGIALLISTLFIWRMRKLKPTDEMVRLTDRENPKGGLQQLQGQAERPWTTITD
ncbi:MAG: protease family protein [Acidobacteriota bacterium]|jgi:membrane protease YdiL (CAAX protease family)|nr:protease family protein [Acidobacteriota bacterium]